MVEHSKETILSHTKSGFLFSFFSFAICDGDELTQPQPSSGPMQYSSTPQVYQSILAPPGPSYGNANKGKGRGGDGIWAHGASQPLQFLHEEPTGNTKYYCKELNGTWLVRTTNDIMNNCQPGDWHTHSQTGYPYFVRKAKD